MSGGHHSEQEEPFYLANDGQDDDEDNKGIDLEIKPAIDLGNEETLDQVNPSKNDHYEGGVEVEPDTAHDFTDLYEIGESLSQETYVHAIAYLCTEKATNESR